MKRPFYEENGGDDSSAFTVYAAPPLECTMLIDTGNQNTQNDAIGKIDTIAVNASISSGAKLFQYNRFYWNKDLFTSNYSNCAVFIAIAYYDGSNLHFAFYPIFLPRTALTTYQSIANNSITSDPTTRSYLINDLLYYLNGAFTGFNYDTYSNAYPVPFVAPPTAPLQGGPTLFSQELKGYLSSPTVNNPKFPIFQTAKEPPLKFILVSSSNQIALVRNNEFWKTSENYPSGASIAFQLVNPEYIFALGPNNPTSSFRMKTGAVVVNNFINVSIPSVFNETVSSGASFSEKGWTSQGIYMGGFAQGRNKQNPVQFSDVYGSSSDRLNLFLQTYFPENANPIAIATTSDFLAWAQQNKLETYICVAKKICSLLPARFFCVKSEVLTRDQKMMPLSNNPMIGEPSTLGVEYLTLDCIRTKVDNTVSGGDSGGGQSTVSNLLNRPISTRVIGSNDTPVTHLNPFYSIQSLDLYMQDEFGTYLQNYRSPSGYTLVYNANFANMSVDFARFSGNLISIIDGEQAFGNGVFTIPAWLAALNPNTAGGNVNPLFGPFSTYLVQALYGLYANYKNIFPSGVQAFQLSSDFAPNIPHSANIIHFGRVLGK